jgi:hypothetical protein
VLSNFSIAEMQYGRLDEAVYLGRRRSDLAGFRRTNRDWRMALIG